jgi:hypothetical protein
MRTQPQTLEAEALPFDLKKTKLNEPPPPGNPKNMPSALLLTANTNFLN